MDNSSNTPPESPTKTITERTVKHVSQRTRSRSASASIGTPLALGPTERKRVLKTVDKGGEKDVSTPSKHPRRRGFLPSYIQHNAHVLAFSSQGNFWEEALIADVNADHGLCTIAWKESNTTEVVPINYVSPYCVELELQMKKDRARREKSRASLQQVVQDLVPATTTEIQRDGSDQIKADLKKDRKAIIGSVPHAVPSFVNIGQEVLAFNDVENEWEPALITKVLPEDATCEILRERAEATELVSNVFIREKSRTLEMADELSSANLPAPSQATHSDLGTYFYLDGAAAIYKLHISDENVYVLMPMVQKMETRDELIIMVCHIKSPSLEEIATLSKYNIELVEEDERICVKGFRKMQDNEYSYVTLSGEDHLNDPVAVHVIFSLNVDIEACDILLHPTAARIPCVDADDMYDAIMYLQRELHLVDAFKVTDLCSARTEGYVLNEEIVQRFHDVLLSLAMAAVHEEDEFNEEEALSWHSSEEPDSGEMAEQDVHTMLLHAHNRLRELEQRLENVQEHQEDEMRRLEDEYAAKYEAVERRVSALEKEVQAILSKAPTAEDVNREAGEAMGVVAE